MRTIFDSLSKLAESGHPTIGVSDALAERALQESQRVRADIERMMMICEALWDILREQHGYSDEELFRRITEIDLRDGRADGRVAPSPPVHCEACGHVVSKHRPICLYCGKPMLKDPFAR